VRLDLGGRELTGERLDLARFSTQLEVHSASIGLSINTMSVIRSMLDLLF
jgi:hypothetical protein